MPEDNKPDSKFFEWRAKQKITPDTDPKLLHASESQYDTGFIIPETTKESDPYTQLADFKGAHQPFIDKLGNAVPRLLSKVGTEILKTPGYMYALGESMGDKTLAESLDNAWIKGLENFDSGTKEKFAQYKPKSVREGSIWNSLTSSSFWLDEGVDGAGFMLGMFVPGAALKATGLATKLSKLPGLANFAKADIELGQATLLNTALESAAETKGVVDNLKQEFATKIGKEINSATGDLWTKEDADKMIGDAGVNTFAMNMALLMVPNTIMNKNLLGRFHSSKSILDDFRDATGKLVANNPISKQAAIKDYLKGWGKSAVSEGFIEEAGQTTIQNYNQKVALNESNSGILEGLANEYINTLTSTEGQKSILLGATLGILGGTVGTYRERKQEDETRNELSKLIKDNFEGFSVDMENVIKRDEKGNVVLNKDTKTPELNIPETAKVIANLVKEQHSTNLQDIAAIENNKDLYDYIYNQQLTKFALPYLKQDGGIEVLNQHLDETSRKLTDISKKFTNEQDFSEGTFKADSKNTVKELQKIYDSIYSSIPDLNLTRLSNNKKDIEDFANELAYTAYAESSKQLFITKKVKELHKELLELKSSVSFDLPQNQLEATKIEERISNLVKSLEVSKEAYKAIYDPIQQDKAFATHVQDKTKFEETIASNEQAVKEGKPVKQPKVKKVVKSTATPMPIDEPDATNVDIDPTQIQDLSDFVDEPPTTPKNISPEEYTYEREKADFLIAEALRTENSEEFSKFEKELKKLSVLTKTEKTNLEAHKVALKALEGIKTDVTNDDDLVARYLSNNTIASTDVANSQVLISPKDYQAGKFKDLERSASKRSNAIMMHLFEHKFIDNNFRFIRDDEGLPVLDNNSNISIDALNKIQVGNTISFKYVDLSKEAKVIADRQRKDSIGAIAKHVEDDNLYKYPLTNDFGFDDKHIGIYNIDNQLIGFVQLPHAISNLVEGDNLQAYIDARDILISQRKHIIKQLDANKEITSTITDKGPGSLYTKLTPEGKIDPINRVLETTRDKDKIAGNSVFVYNSGTELKLPILEDKKAQEAIEESIAKLGNWGEKGAVYQLVKATNDEWYPIPVYANLIDDKTAGQILKTLELLPEDVDPITVIRNLQPYIYASETNGNVIVTNDGANTKLTINADTFTLGSIHAVRKEEFISALKTKRQNIDRRNINTRAVQAKLKDRNTLITNATTFQGEYFVQPYLQYKNVIDTVVTIKESKDTEDNVTVPPVINPLTDEELRRKFDITDEDFQDNAFSRVRYFNPYSTNKVDKEKFTKWLDENLPGLSVYNTVDISELKTNIRDAVGLYKDMVIYLFNNSSNKTAYHEAFHGVFRNMLSANKRLELINEFAKNTLKPTKENLEYIQQAYKKEYTDKQLEYFYYEELLADAFADYTDTFEPKTWSDKILDFFKKILTYFNLYTNYDNNKLDELFYNINAGVYKATSIKAKEAVANRATPSFTEYVPSRIKDPKGNWELSASFKWDRTKSIGDNFLAEYQKIINSGGKVTKETSLNIYNDILSKYNSIIEDAKKNPTKYTKEQIVNTMKVVSVFPQLTKEVNKYLETIGIKVKDNNIEYKEQEVTDENDIDNEISTLVSHTTKGFNEWISIPGLKSTSTRLKMFLSSIPIIEKSQPKTDLFGFPMYHDFLKLYYFLERNLTGSYTFNEMLEVLDELAINRPEIKTVKTKLLEPENDITPEKLELLQNDFKSNFSKQQLSYTLVKFDTESSTGAVTFEIMDANRQSLGREIFDSWANNLADPARNTIAVHNQDGTVTTTGTIKAKELLSQWNNVKTKKELDLDIVNNILLKAGIEYSPLVLKKLVHKSAEIFKRNVTKLLTWYSADDASKFQIEGRKALSKLVQYEVLGKLSNYTQSFNNVENKSIYTIQLPSFASKLLSKITSHNANKFYEEYDELTKDSSYKYSNILEELKDDFEFRTEGFKLNYLDGLKDDRGNSDGAKFTNMSPKDFMAMQIALFENNNANQYNMGKKDLSKYIYITPSDKTMSMIFDSKRYGVNIGAKGLNVNSEILGKFYNVVLQEASRIKNQLAIKSKVMKGELTPDDLLEHYHYNKDTPPIKDENGNWKLESIKWNGQAFKFNNFGDTFNKIFLSKIKDRISKDFNSDVEQDLEVLKPLILDELISELNKEYKITIAEAIKKGIITKEGNEYKNVALDRTSKNFKNIQSEHLAIRQTIAEFALNSWLFNIEASKLLNGDSALYKPADLQKRTYQSGSMTIMGNTSVKPKVRTIVVKDHIVKSEFTDNPEYNKINSTDAQVYITPEFYKSIHIARGTWTDNMQKAYDIAEGNEKPDNIDQSLKQLLGGLKPFYFGKRFDDTLGIQRYEQVKCSMLPLFKSYTDMNLLLAEKRQEMSNINADMIAHESSFKAAIGYRTGITSDDYITLDLDMNNFGIQVDNPNHALDESNDSIRQIKMLLLGNIDPDKEYNGTSGRELQYIINTLEGVNVLKDLERLKLVINNPSDMSFKKSMQERLTKRGATENVQQSLDIVNGEFVFPLDLGPTSTATENLISSIFTNDVIKQKFNSGGSAVQATALGLKYKSLEEQQKAIEANPELYKLQTDLKWVRPGKGDKVEYAEAIMPAWAKDFFKDNGMLKDNIPDELREILVYRIPTEGYHSMLPIKVVKFLPETMGNFIMLPYEITTQFGADFDFDKIYFIAPEFYKDIDEQKNSILTKYEYIDGDSIENKDKRYKQYLRWAASNDEFPMSEEDFFEQTIEEQNNRSARNNKILDSYMKVLSSKETYPLLIKPSGFEVLKSLKNEIVGEKESSNFFSSKSQREFKQRNHIGLGLKGQSALHVSGHSYATMLDLNVEKSTPEGLPDSRNVFRFNNTESYSLSDLNNKDGELITDELSTMMAAILDDIKDPILEPLGINQYTIDVWATIVRSGFGTKTAINLITQPAIRELSDKLQENAYQIKAVNQGWNTVDSLLNDYKHRLRAVTDKLSENGKLEIKTELDKINAYNLTDKQLEYWRKWKEDNILNVTEDEKYNQQLALYYTYQVRVLNNYGRYDKISKDLVKINRFFGINKEVGPNIENIIDKKYLLNEITDETFSINGMNNLSRISGLDADYDTHITALEWFSKYFPYDSNQNNAIKTNVALKQFKVKHNTSVILSIKSDTRMKINGFLRTFIDNKFGFFINVNSFDEKKKLFTEVPKLLSQIKDPRNDKKDFNDIKEGYKKLRSNIFIEQLQVKVDNGLGYISLKGNKLDTQIKNNITEAIYSLWNNVNTRSLVIDLIKHSYASTGFFTGLNSFHSLIPLDILSEINYNTYRRNVLNKLNKGEMLFNEEAQDRIIDQLIRNFPKDFTKVFDKGMFTEKDKVLYTNDESIKIAKRGSDMFIGQTEEGITIYPMYIRVYDKVLKRSLIYKQTNPGEYHYVTNLGKAGKLIEIDITNNIEKSIVRDNNSMTRKSNELNVTTSPEDLDIIMSNNEPTIDPVLESSEFGVDPTTIQDLGDFEVKEEPKADINDLFGNVDDKPPLDFDPNAKDNCN